MMTPDPEEVLDCAMNGQESLRANRGFETPHLALALSRRLMRHLGPAVLVSSSVVYDRRHDSAACRDIALQLVSDEPPGLDLLSLEQLPEEPECCARIPACLREDVDHISVFPRKDALQLSV